MLEVPVAGEDHRDAVFVGQRKDPFVVNLGEIFDLAALAKDCAEDKRYEFLFVAPALPITGAVGSPVNPLAIK